MKERRLHPRFKIPDTIAMVKVPNSPLDYYFHVDNLSLGGLLLLTRTPIGFPIHVDTVMDVQVFSPPNAIHCRGVAVRIVRDESGDTLGFALKLYGFADGDEALYQRLVEEAARNEEA